MPQDLLTAAAYIRVSTDDQTEYSPTSQLKIIRDYAKNNGMILPEEYVFMEPDGVSGRKAEKRPEFQRMIGFAKSPDHPIDVILLWKFSRFARNQEESIVYKSLLRRENVDVVSVSEPLVEGPFGSLIERIIEWMDEYYSIRLSGEVRRGMNESASRGNCVSGIPFGYRKENRKLIPDPNLAPLVENIFQWYVHDGMGMREIAKKLNNMDIRTKSGNLMENRTIEYILRNPVYIGKLRWNMEGWTRRNFNDPNIQIYEGKHDPLIDLETWEAAQQRITEVKAKWGKYSRPEHVNEFFLRGLIRCSSCGATLVNGGNHGLQCANYNRGSCHDSHYISLGKAQTQIVEAIRQDFESGDFDLEIRPSSAARPDNALIDRQLVQEARKMQRVKEAYENGVDTLAEYRENKAKIQAKIDALNAEKELPPPPASPREELIAQNEQHLKTLLSPESTDKEKNEAIRAFVDRIVFDRVKKTFTIFYGL